MRFLEVFSLRFFFCSLQWGGFPLRFLLNACKYSYADVRKIVSYEITHEITIFLFFQNTPVQVDNYTLLKDFETQFINEDFQIQSICHETFCT